MKRRSILLPAILLVAAVIMAGCGEDDNAPGSHTEDLGGVLHAPGFAEPRLNCIACHGIGLDGGEGPGCFGCHPAGSL